MSIINQELWDSYVEKNKDPYGKCCVDVARKVMEFLDLNEEFEPSVIINQADDTIGAGGITGFMAGCVAQMVIQCHSRGDEFRKKWNKSYGVEDENEKRVVNPAIINIEVNNG